MAMTFSDLRRLQLGGFTDTSALLSVAAGVMATNPAIAPASWTFASALGLGLGATGGGWFGKRLHEVLGRDALGGSTLRINSSEPPPPTDDGMLLGYIVGTGEPLIIPMDQWVRHAMIVGQSGVGKTVQGAWLMFQQIARGGGVLWIDGKLDPGNVEMLRQMCAWAGREDDLLVINPGDPENSNTYNPILYGDPDEISARCLSLIPSTESNPGADYYRQEANQGITTLVNTIQACGLAFNFADMTVLMSNPAALSWLEQRVPYGSEAQQQFSLFLHKFKLPQKNGQVSIDVKKLKDQLGGIGGRMFTFGTGKFGQVLNTYDPEVRLKEDILANKIIYVMLPTMGKAEAASNFGKMTIGDFRTAISKIQELPKDQRPWPPTLSFYDEAGSFVTQAWSRMFEQTRSAQLQMCPAFQTKANLEVLGDELLRTVAGNTMTKFFFKPGESDTAEFMADLIGQEKHVTHTISANRGAGSSTAAHLNAQPSGWTDSGAVAFTETVKEEYRITGSELMQLGQGECVVTYDGSKVYHIRTPMIRFDSEIAEAASIATINHKRPKRVKGLEMMKNIERWTGGSGDAGFGG